MKSDSVPLPHVRFGPFEVDFETGEVRKHGLKLKLQEKPLRVLQALVEKPGKLVTREDLRSKLWPEDHYVDFDRNLTIAMNRLRTVLSDSADEPRYIETLPRRGYRFIYPMDGKGLPGSDATLSEGVPSNRAIPGLLARHRKATIGTAAIVMALIGLVWFPLRRHPQSSSELTQKRLTFNSNENAVDGSALSPDGKYLAYSDPAGIHIKLVASGEERVLPRPAGLPPGAWWGAVSWFPDGTQLLGDLHQPDGHVSIWTLSVLGQSARQ
ncbi:MAG TPA: winged helix-turn-helix domain-containing protein, partial [Terriglobia bacterium]|nr:winged helix-turn-helix domain-containing protein [Terriglobia bacterium]